MAYTYRLTKKALERLPKHYIDRCIEFNARPGAVLNYRHDHRTHRLDKWGVKVPVQNVPPPIKFPQVVNDGLWGGEGFVQGFLRQKLRIAPRKPKLWQPSLSNRVFYSEILNTHFIITVTSRVHNIIDELYGLDAYILKTREHDLNSRLGMNLKRHMLITLVQKSMYPDDHKKRDAIYEKYKEFIIPLEEAEWLGLSIEDALKKQAEIDKISNPILPQKIHLAEKFLTQIIENPKDIAYQQNKVIGLLGKLTPFKKTES